ncbi:MAG: PLP-dependent aspartate aminotransferase family protein [Acidaminobacteraceae bacterium]
MKIETKLTHIGVGKDPHTGSITTPIYQVATFEHPCVGESTGYDYSRSANPTRKALEDGIKELEEADAGFAFASGMAAVVAVLTLFKSGDHFVVTEDSYGGTYRVLNEIFAPFGFEVTFVDTSSTRDVRDAIRLNTKAILVESPTNPLLKIADIDAISSLAKERGILTVVDNTFMTPFLQKPLNLGADIVIHSASKYLGGHNDVVAGLVVTKGEKLSEKLYQIQNATGAILGPQDCWLLIRGIKTLSLRMERQMENALSIAKWLEVNKLVKSVYYPGLSSSKGFELQSRQAKGYGAMLSFEMIDIDSTKEVINGVSLIKFAESLGGVESLITYPCTQTHAELPEDFRNKLGISDTLLRLSVGIEHIDDLILDLKTAFDNIK